MGKPHVVWFGMKVTPEQKQKIKLLAKRQGVSAKETVMRLVEEALIEEKIIARKGSFLFGIEQLIG